MWITVDKGGEIHILKEKRQQLAAERTMKEEILMRDFQYHLPEERIATHPLPKRDESKLLVYKSGRMEKDQFSHLAQQLPEGATLILNDTRVIEARIFFTKPTGGAIEIFCLEPHGQAMEVSLQAQGSVEWKCMIGGASKWKAGQVLQKSLQINGNEAILEARYVQKVEDAFIIHFSWATANLHFAQVLHAAGDIPLPPYLKRGANAGDEERYQTIFARQEGSVAAPTAALHFTEQIFDSLAEKGISTHFVTLNVGAGTFKPVKTASIADHLMHSETFSISRATLAAILEASIVVAVGTTSLRTIESVHWLGVKLLAGTTGEQWELEQWEVYNLDKTVSYRQSISAILQWMEEKSVDNLHCRTSLLIVPGYRFAIPSAIITNFHQPQSTLLLLIAAFIGNDWKTVYHYALENDFRFLSYGDSSLLWRNDGEGA